jgi:hypothetical protein
MRLQTYGTKSLPKKSTAESVRDSQRPTKSLYPVDSRSASVDKPQRRLKIRRSTVQVVEPWSPAPAMPDGWWHPGIEPFWSKADRSGDGCWEWQAAKDSDGYGYFTAPKYDRADWPVKGRRASRVAWTLTNGPIPDGLLVCHHCDNPTCVRPSHLFLGTQADNIADMLAKGRGVKGRKMPGPNRLRGENANGARLTEAEVYRIRVRYSKGKVTQRDLATEFGVDVTLVSLIIKGKVWKHVGGPISNGNRLRTLRASTKPADVSRRPSDTSKSKKAMKLKKKRMPRRVTKVTE